MLMLDGSLFNSQIACFYLQADAIVSMVSNSQIVILGESDHCGDLQDVFIIDTATEKSRWVIEFSGTAFLGIKNQVVRTGHHTIAAFVDSVDCNSMLLEYKKARTLKILETCWRNTDGFD